MAELEPEKEEQRPITLGTDCTECIFFEDPSMFSFSNQRTTSGFCRLGKIAKFEEQNAYFEEIDGKIYPNFDIIKNKSRKNILSFYIFKS